MIKRLTTGFDSLMKKYTPDPFIYALALTILVFLLSLLITDKNLLTIAETWGLGFWSLSTFTMQMVMVLFLGYVVALSTPIKSGLSYLSGLPRDLPEAAVYTTILALIGALLNWGFGLIISALFCKQLGLRFKGKKFAVLVACSYSGFIVWHGGLSGSIPLVVSTPGNFSETLLKGTVPLSQTIFSNLNLVIVFAHLITMPILSYFLMRSSRDSVCAILEDRPQEILARAASPAERWERNPLFIWAIVFIAVLYATAKIKNDSFTIDLNQINLFLFILALILHKTPRGFLDASAKAVEKIWPILVQYPLYAGIMAIMQNGGLAEIISDWFVNLASAKTLPFLVYLSAGLVNIFIPSGGGQWAVQGPMAIKAATELGANVNATMMAVAWGDAWTNMIQPFWALPLLAIAGLKPRDIMGSLVFVFLLSGVITSLALLLI
jgi:short-chain fatty acids transporter